MIIKYNGKGILVPVYMIVSVLGTRLNKRLPKDIVYKIESKYSSFIGLEMILDTVESIQIEKLEEYLHKI